MPTITVRALSPTGDVMYGQGQNNFISDLQAVSQIIRTRLLLLLGEWFEDLTTGTPIFQSMVGRATTNQTLAMVIQQRTIGTPYVLSISNVSTSYNPGAGLQNSTSQGIAWNDGAWGFTPWGGIVGSNSPSGPGPGARSLSFSCSVQTQFGSINIASAPAPSVQFGNSASINS